MLYVSSHLGMDEVYLYSESRKRYSETLDVRESCLPCRVSQIALDEDKEGAISNAERVHPFKVYGTSSETLRVFIMNGMPGLFSTIFADYERALHPIWLELCERADTFLYEKVVAEPLPLIEVAGAGEVQIAPHLNLSWTCARLSCLCYELARTVPPSSS
ncbi:hypothetical protein NLI96_g1351 [Meripilus lineatus]|uniref:Uncharacterized protein n=1 Tax=Meripilus lineatus TaxID=2056292 RepID=A0AAD5VC94_9APHY|nr:hypothetical protein NLI96_g1351 [Physisporinus lineatus]